VPVSAFGQLAVRLPVVSVDRRARLHRLGDEREHTVGGDIGDVPEPDPPESLALGFSISTAIATIAFPGWLTNRLETVVCGGRLEGRVCCSEHDEGRRVAAPRAANLSLRRAIR
jgi:hypothetical protein